MPLVANPYSWVITNRRSRMTDKTALVISAHVADFVWRYGGAIALHADKGYDVTVVCFSFGEPGEVGN